MSKPVATSKPGKFVEKKSAWQSGWEVKKQFDDPRFGQCMILGHVDSAHHKVDEQQILMKEYLTNSEKDAVAHIEIMKQRMNLDHPHLQRLQDWAASKKSDFCSTYYKFRGYYTYPMTSMADTLFAIKANQSMDHEGLTHIMYQMLDAMNYLHHHQKCFNDFRPEYVGTISPNYYILCDRLRMPGNAYDVQSQIYINSAKKRMYMSPVLWHMVNEGKKNLKDFKVDEKKNDVWSLGMVLLSAGLGKTVKEQNSLYIKKTKTTPARVDMAKIQSWIAEFKGIYAKDANSILGLITEQCLIESDNERPSCEELLKEQLPPYKEVCDHFAGVIVHEEVHIPETFHEEVIVEQSPVEYITYRPEIVDVVTTTDTAIPHGNHVDHLIEEKHNLVEINEPRIIRQEPKVIREYYDLQGNK
jgi:serine/threonine protein kinase